MNQHCKCDSCDFELSTGHSHHTGYSWALCTACAAEYVLPTKSHWGPSDNELIVLHAAVRKQVYRHKKKPPREEVIATATDQFLIAEPAEEWGVDYPVEHIECPACKAVGRLALDFVDRQSCPKCKTGSLSCSWAIY